MTINILLVDDEPRVLAALNRQISEEDFCVVYTAQSAQQGLEILESMPEFSTVVSDYHMTGMDGVTFLAEVQKINPDATRIILTGAANLNMAIQSVNYGKIFRFLLKPCPPDEFIATVKAGIRQYQLITAEKELLGKTLNGSIKIMVDILSAINPESFALTSRVREMVCALAAAMQMDRVWEVEIAALLSQIGCITVPREILEKWTQGLPLKEKEMQMIESIPRISAQLVKNLPRLENIANTIEHQNDSFIPRFKSSENSGERIPVHARILKIVLDYHRFLTTMDSPKQAVEAMKKHSLEYDPRMFNIFQTKVLGLSPSRDESIERLPERSKTGKLSLGSKMIDIEDLQPGMILLRDIFDRNGRLVVAKDTLITDVLLYRLINFHRSQSILDPVLVRADDYR